jgi:hypothetical protein
MSQVTAGSFVVHRNQPHLGTGKVFCAGYQYVLVGFVDAAGHRQVKRLAHDFVVGAPAPQDLSPFDGWHVEVTTDCKEVLPAPRGKSPRPLLVAEWTIQEAYERFLHRYPGSFPSEKYVEKERAWKWSQHVLWHELLPGDRLRELARSDPHEAGARIMKVVQTKVVPVLSRKGEIPALNWALREGAPTPFLLALADVIDQPEPDRDRFDALANALDSLPTRDAKTRLLTWPTLTLVPFLVRPEHHLFVKPKPTKDAARGLGVDLLYDTRPSWDVYERMLEWSGRLLEFLRPRGARDLIDVQSFIWTIAEPLA